MKKTEKIVVYNSDKSRAEILEVAEFDGDNGNYIFVLTDGTRRAFDVIDFTWMNEEELENAAKVNEWAREIANKF